MYQSLTREQITKLIAQLEIPDCSCEPTWTKHDDGTVFVAPCQHIQSSQHTLALESWAELLRLASAAEYEPRPTPPQPTFTLSRKSRVEVYRQRIADGFHWQHPGDLQFEQVDFMANMVRRRRNGSLEECGLKGVTCN